MPFPPCHGSTVPHIQINSAILRKSWPFSFRSVLAVTRIAFLRLRGLLQNYGRSWRRRPVTGFHLKAWSHCNVVVSKNCMALGLTDTSSWTRFYRNSKHQSFLGFRNFSHMCKTLISCSIPCVVLHDNDNLDFEINTRLISLRKASIKTIE